MLKRLFKYYFLLLGVFATAQVSFNAIVNKTQTKIGERIQLSYVIITDEDAEINNLNFPKIRDFQVLGKQTGNNLSYTNGKVTREFVKTMILFANKAGKFTIRPAKVEIDGKVYESNAVEIVVSKAEQNDNSSTPNLENENVKLELTLSKEEVYPNEGIIADIKLYAKSYDFLRRRSDLEIPGISGFQVKQLSKNNDRNLEQEVINGSVYVSEKIAQIQLIPTQTGNIEIPEFKIRLAIPIDFFDEKVILLKTEPKTIKVKNLPKNAPKGFSGAIGNFKINSDLEDKKYYVNEPIEFEIELIGEGNLSTIELPELNLDSKLEIYPPQIRNSFKETIKGEKGKIVNRYVVVPQYGGNYTIPEIMFSFFNPDTEQYETIRTNPLDINVEGGENENLDEDNNEAAYDSLNKAILPEKVQEINQKVKELIKIPNLVNQSDSNKKLYWIVFLIPIIGLLIFYIIYNKKSKVKLDDFIVDKKTIKNRIKETLDRLEIAKNHQDINNFTTESSKLLNQVVALFSDEEEEIIYTESQASEILSCKMSDTFIYRWEKLHRRNLLMRYSGILSRESLDELYSEYETLVKDSMNKQ